MGTRQVVLELLADHIDVVVYDGSTRLDARRIPITIEEDDGQWARSLRRNAATLRSLVDELNVGGAPVAVLYRSPTHAVELSGLAVSSVAQAVEAAKMSCTDSLSYSAMSAVCEGEVVGRDAAGTPRQTHVVVAAEREDIADAIVQLVEEAGLKFVSATPIDAAVLAGLVREAMAEKGATLGRLYVGEFISFFVVARGGRLLFSRRIDLGLESLATSLTRPIRTRNRDEPIELDMEGARTVLHQHGIPPRDKVVHDEYGLTGGEMMPPLQPILQRFVIELRQSLRFGVSDEERADLTIRLIGPGSALPGLADLFARELSVETNADSSCAGYDWAAPGSDAGELADALRDRNFLKRLNLMPLDLAVRRRTGRLRRWLWTGAAAALVVIAADAVRYHLRLDGARMQANAWATQLAQAKKLKATEEKLQVVMEALSEVERTVDREIGLVPDYRACMQELSRITPATVRFTAVGFQRQPGVIVGSVSGYAFQRSPDTQRTDLEAFIDQLRSSPLFEDVVLGNVNKGTIKQAEGERFDATFVMIGVQRNSDPAATIAAAAVVVGGESAP